MKVLNAWSQEPQQTPTEITADRHLIAKMLKYKDKDKILQSVRVKWHSSCKRIMKKVNKIFIRKLIKTVFVDYEIAYIAKMQMNYLSLYIPFNNSLLY